MKPDSDTPSPWVGALGLAVLGAILLFPVAQACTATCALPGAPPIFDSHSSTCPDTVCIPIPAPVQGLLNAIHPDPIGGTINIFGVCAGIYSNSATLNLDLNGGLVLRGPVDPSNHFAFGNTSGTC